MPVRRRFEAVWDGTLRCRWVWRGVAVQRVPPRRFWHGVVRGLLATGVLWCILLLLAYLGLAYLVLR